MVETSRQKNVDGPSFRKGLIAEDLNNFDVVTRKLPIDRDDDAFPLL